MQVRRLTPAKRGTGSRADVRLFPLAGERNEHAARISTTPPGQPASHDFPLREGIGHSRRPFPTRFTRRAGRTGRTLAGWQVSASLEKVPICRAFFADCANLQGFLQIPANCDISARSLGFMRVASPPSCRNAQGASSPRSARRQSPRQSEVRRYHLWNQSAPQSKTRRYHPRNQRSGVATPVPLDAVKRATCLSMRVCVFRQGGTLRDSGPSRLDSVSLLH